jgi:hypothetical protein
LKQLNLFEATNQTVKQAYEQKLLMSKDELIKWKARIAKLQKEVRDSKIEQQQQLFEVPKTTWHSWEEIDPFSLRQHPFNFYRRPQLAEPPDETNHGVIYFIIDKAMPIILYIGETKKTATDRWTGVHYCKEYLKRYIQLHRDYQLETLPASAFWQHILPEKKILRQWEKSLIEKWLPPFNKQMWSKFGQPFGRI